MTARDRNGTWFRTRASAAVVFDVRVQIDDDRDRVALLFEAEEVARASGQFRSRSATPATRRLDRALLAGQ